MCGKRSVHVQIASHDRIYRLMQAATPTTKNRVEATRLVFQQTVKSNVNGIAVLQSILPRYKNTGWNTCMHFLHDLANRELDDNRCQVPKFERKIYTEKNHDQILKVQSDDVETRLSSAGLNCTLCTASSCPFNSTTKAFDTVSKTCHRTHMNGVSRPKGA